MLWTLPANDTLPVIDLCPACGERGTKPGADLCHPCGLDVVMHLEDAYYADDPEGWANLDGLFPGKF